MELIDIAENSKLIKIGFVGYHAETKESLIRAIYNVIAIRNGNQWVLKRASDYETRNWNEKKVNSITYRFPKGKTINQHDIVRQEADIIRLCNFFECSPIPITYYSCYDPKQVFEVKGFDYLPNMYYSQTGGMADYGNIIYSGNNSEYYTHEIVHIYAKKRFPKIESLLDEGMATYLGGSGIYDYNWHREKFKTYMNTSSIDLAEHMQPYEQLYIDNVTPIPYMIGALICERTNRLYGKKELFKLLGSADELWVKLNRYGLTIDNLTEELKKELNYGYEWEFRATRKPITRSSYLERSTVKCEFGVRESQTTRFSYLELYAV
jgi:hypothetical protein